jgi:2-succinyl-6-hydroxy-2,4-cyclohexadiene-1-carboxylate synthase
MTWVALHGFTQRGAAWDETAALAGGDWVTPDLPGHGGQPACSWEEAVRIVAGRLGEAAPPRCLVGYSMGGRLALAVALDHPEMVERLALLSAAPGIADPVDRRQRLEADRALAEHIAEAGVAAFLDEWLDQPWFGGGQTPPAEWRAAERTARMGSTAAGLAGALRLLGQGAQPYLGERLGELALPVLLVAGADDGRYAALARSMAEQMPNAEVALVAAAGHALVGERPGEVAALLAAWSARR